MLHQRKLFKQIAWIAIRLRRRWLEYTQRTTWFIPWVRPASLLRRTGEPHRISPMLHASREYDELSTWAAWETRTKRSPRICGVVTKLRISCEVPGIPTIEFRASIVIGSGSLSFEMIRALVQRLPVMICPRWVDVKAQPIGVEDLIAYLMEALALPVEQSSVFEIGGTDQVSYGEIMQEYAHQCGLRRWMVSVPVLTPRLSSLWLGLVTPIYARIGRKLIDSMRNPTLVRDPSARTIFTVKPKGLREAIERALHHEDQEFARTRWSDALSSSGKSPSWRGVRVGTRLIDSRSVQVSVSPTLAFAPILRIGGSNGWYFANFLWWCRGFVDLLVGGVGLRRGRRDPDTLAVGDALDFWRVDTFEPNRQLTLVAEMKIPGRAWLQFEVEPNSRGSVIKQTAIFDPAGLAGLLYWYILYPVHLWIFSGMLHKIAAIAVRPASIALSRV